MKYLVKNEYSGKQWKRKLITTVSEYNQIQFQPIDSKQKELLVFILDRYSDWSLILPTPGIKLDLF